MMSGTTQQAGAIMRYSEEHYPLLTKFRVGPDPLEAEAKNTKIEPTSSTRQAVMGMVLRQVTGDDEGQLSRELVRKWEQKRQLEALPKQVDTWFAAEFMRWLRGVSVFNSKALTPWGNANLFHIPEVLAYLREACACRADFQRKLVHLAIFEPRTLNDAYLYYKYIVMHHGWSKEQGGPHLANNPRTPPYLTIGGALDFLDDYSLTTFQDQALAMQALNAPEPRLYGPNQDLPRPEPNAAPTAQPAPGVPPAPGDPDAHAGGHDDEDEDDDDDRPPGGSVPSTAGVLATSAAIARERAEREAVAAAIAHRMALNNAAATRAQQRQAEDALEELNAADVDGDQSSGGSVPTTAGVLATSAAIARGRAEQEAAAATTRQTLAAASGNPALTTAEGVAAAINARSLAGEPESYKRTLQATDLAGHIAGLDRYSQEHLVRAARYQAQNPDKINTNPLRSRKYNSQEAARIAAAAALLNAMGEPLAGPAVPLDENGHRPSHALLDDLAKRLYQDSVAHDLANQRARGAAPAKSVTVASPGGTPMSPGGTSAGADAPQGTVTTPASTPETAASAGPVAAPEPPGTPMGKGGTRATDSPPLSGPALRAAADKIQAGFPTLFGRPSPYVSTPVVPFGSSSSSADAAPKISTIEEYNKATASFVKAPVPSAFAFEARLAHDRAQLTLFNELAVQCTPFSQASLRAHASIKKLEEDINATQYRKNHAQ